MANPFKSVVLTNPGRSVFNLSHYKLLTCDLGELIPVLCEEVVPGDVFHIGNEIVVRFRPLVAPILHEVNVFVHYFFVPYRLIWSSWEDFITGGEDGSDATSLPTWNVTTNTEGSLWDYLGFPLSVDAAGARPIAFPQYAYNQIYNDYYRDQKLVTALTITTNEDIKKRAWERDYFTSALASQELGTSPALSVTLSGLAPLDATSATQASEASIGANETIGADATNKLWYADDGAHTEAEFQAMWAKIDADLSSGTAAATSISLHDLRQNLAIQRWMELNNRVGARYTEFLKGHFGTAPQDGVLQRPRYLGGSKNPVIVSEVLQTSETNTTEQGTMVGHALAVGQNFCAKARISEYGLIMGIMSVMPRTMYHQGIERMWSEKKSTRYDFYNPMFANLSEQPVYESEIYCSGTESEHNTVFGYQARYNEYRHRRNYVCGAMHGTFDYWHMCRQFGGRPTLNETFITANPRKDYLASSTEDGLLVSVGNLIRAIRPMPVFANPGGRL